MNLMVPAHALTAAYSASAAKVAVTHLREDAVNVSEIDWSKPTAVLLGNEAEGAEGSHRNAA